MQKYLNKNLLTSEVHWLECCIILMFDLYSKYIYLFYDFQMEKLIVK